MNNTPDQRNQETTGGRGEKSELRIGSFNIHGAVTAGKAEALMEWAYLESMDIIGIQETNMTRGAAVGINRRHHEDYISWWANGEEGATQGRGIGMLISKRWHNHGGRRDTCGSRGMAQDFNFYNGLKLVVINCYIPSGRANGVEADKILTWVRTTYERAMREEREVILLGDFNGVMNPQADRKHQPGNYQGTQPETSLLKWVKLQPLQDAFRVLHPIERTFTFGDVSRLDMIFVSDRLAARLLTARHEDMHGIVASDHAMATASINMYNLINGLAKAITTTTPKGVRFKFKSVTDEQWEEFRNETEIQLAQLSHDGTVGLQPFTSSDEKVSIATFKKLKVELAWNRFARIVYKGAEKALPKKMAGRKDSKPEEEMALKYVVRAAASVYKTASKIWRTDQAWRQRTLVEQLDRERKHFNEMRERLNDTQPNQNLVDRLEKPPEADAEDVVWRLWRSVVKRQWRESLGVLMILRKIESPKKIKEAIEKRNELMTTETGKVLDSILGRGSGKVVLDRIQIEENGNTTTETDPKKVKERVVEWFNEWYKPRPAQPLDDRRWKEQYQPQKDIDEEWYDRLMDAPTRQEFDEATGKAPKLKAPGLSGITNEILQQLGEVGDFILYQMVGAGIVQGDLPTAWKTGLLYCIPKTSEWSGNMAEIRPITLLEHARKIMFSILTARLSTIMSTHGILRGPNFSVLKGTTTKDPIHILLAMMEDARESGREQWIVFQDMRRCFDSVNCGKDGMLSRALRRLKVPEQFIQLCEMISETKANRVITDFGTTENFQPRCGLDQGGIECPLLWRIAYDPLLCEVMDNCKGYQIRGPSTTPEVAALAFVDDTTWVADGKDSAQYILDVATEFFDLNGIEINGKKTKVIAINNKRSKEDSALQFGTPPEAIYPVGKKEAVRTLGVWVNAAGSPKPTTDLIENEADTICTILRRKAITDKQAGYIVNSVLVNRIIYRTSVQLIPQSTLKRLTGKYMKLCKIKARLPSTTPNSVMAHHRFYAIKRLEDAQAEEQISSLWLRLNDTGIVGRICRARLLRLQQQLKMDVPPTREPHGVTSTRHSFISGVCELMAKRDISFDVQAPEDFELNKDAGTILEFLGDEADEEIVTECRNLGIYYIEQVLSVNKAKLISWKELRQMVGYRKVSKDSPPWFLRFQNYCATDRFTEAFVTNWCHDRRAAMEEIDAAEKEAALARVDYQSEVSEDPETEEDEHPAPPPPPPPSPPPPLPPPPLPQQVGEAEEIAMPFIPTQALRRARREGTVVRPRIVETIAGRQARQKAYQEEYYKQRGGPKLRVMDDGEDEFRRTEYQKDVAWGGKEHARLRNLAKLEEKEKRQHEAARQAAQERRQQEAARQVAQERRQQEAARQAAARQVAQERRQQGAARQKARQDRIRHRLKERERRIKRARRRWKDRVSEVKRRFQARKAAISRMRKKYLEPNNRIKMAELERDAKEGMDKAATPRARPLPTKRTFRDIYGLVITDEVESAIQEQRSSLEGHELLEFYSDGSLTDYGDTTVSMAFGVVIKKPGEDRYSNVASGKVLGFASSTKAELVGLLATILVCPRDTKATVYIDNKSVVQRFAALVLRRRTSTVRQRLRSKYAVWWAAISRAFERQGEKIDVKWVKGHSGNAGNNMADTVAKGAHAKDTWDLDPSVHTGMNCHAMFKGKLVEVDPRQLLKQQSVARTHHQWANQGRTKAWIKDWREIEWRTTLAIVHNYHSPRSMFTSTSDCSKRAHRIKKIHGMLPTRAYQRRWRPDLYEDASCRVCEVADEDITHIWRCPETLEGQGEGWEEAIEMVIDLGGRLWQRAKQMWTKKKEDADKYGEEFNKEQPTFSAASAESVWTVLEDQFRGVRNIRVRNLLEDDLMREEEQVVDFGDIQVERQWTVIEAYHGLAPLYLKDKFKRLFGTTTAIAKIMADKFMKNIEDYGRTGLWNPRCKKTVDWEKTVGITAVSKRARPERPGTRVGEHGGSSSDYNSFDQNAANATRVKTILKTADKRVLQACQGKVELNIMERTGGVKYILEKDLGE